MRGWPGDGRYEVGWESEGKGGEIRKEWVGRKEGVQDWDGAKMG